jgi:hypothetical protein
MKNVIRSFVMLGVIFGLMVMGCPTEEKEEVKETIPKQYQGKFSATSNGNTHYIEFTKNQLIYSNSWDVWAEGNEIYSNVANSNFSPYTESGTRKFKFAQFTDVDNVTVYAFDGNSLQYTRVHD